MTPIEQKIMIQRHLPRLKIADVKIVDGYWRAYVALRYPLSGELKQGWYRVKDLINEVGCGNYQKTWNNQKSRWM